MNLYTAPEPFPTDDGKLSIFLAGSIENGEADDWQSLLIEKLDPYDINVLNPRRMTWDSTVKQSKDDPLLNEQVNWELDALESSMMIVMYLDPNTKSAISLMELGMFAHKSIVVCCPEGFWRKGNVDIVCERNKAPVFEDMDVFIDKVVGFVESQMKESPDKQKEISDTKPSEDEKEKAPD